MSNFSLQVETALVYLSGCIALLLRNTLIQSLWNRTLSEWHIFWLDLAACVLPLFLVQTFLTDYILLFLIAHSALAAMAFMFCGARSGVATPFRALRPFRIESARAVRDSHTMFRALLLITTAVAILAVDFSLFPRRLAKTHYYGQSLMDTGTAAFVFVNALADQGAESRGQNPGERALKATMNVYFLRVPTLLVLFLLGIGRSLFVNFSGYSQDVTEYGVHWNFFVTLFFIKVYTILVPSNLIVPTGFFLAIAHQLALSFTGMEEWILGTFHPREGFIDQNREGIFSMFGYFFIYSASLLYARFSSAFLQKDRKLSPLRAISLLAVGALCYLVQRLLEDLYFGLMASRRLANLPYCFAMMALFTSTTTLFQAIQIVAPLPQSKGGLVEAISRNGLLHFLLANLLTGFVNISMHLVVKVRGKLAETLIMLAYSFATSFFIFAVYLAKKRRSQV